VGSLREDIRPRDLVVPDQVIDKTCRRVPTFFDSPSVHVEFASPFCPVLRRHLLDCASAAGAAVHDGGTYVCMEGPAFSTRAGERDASRLGGDVIGMTCMPEAKLAARRNWPTPGVPAERLRLLAPAPATWTSTSC